MKEDDPQYNDDTFKSTQSNTNTIHEESISEGKEEDYKEKMLTHNEERNANPDLKEINAYIKDAINSKEMIDDFNNSREDLVSKIKEYLEEMEEMENNIEEEKPKFRLKKTESENKPKFLTKKQRRPKLQKMKPKENIIVKKIKKKSGRHTSNIRKKPHDKKSKDNIMRKIKVHIIQKKIRNLINDYLKVKKIKKRLIKLSTKDINRLKKDQNETFMEKTLREIYKEYKFGKKTEIKDLKYNEKLIDEIYAREDLKDLQNLLDLNYMEFYKIYTVDVIRKKLPEDLADKKNGIEKLLGGRGIKTDFLDELEKKYEKDGEKKEDINEYINLVKNCIENYEEWFKGNEN